MENNNQNMESAMEKTPSNEPGSIPENDLKSFIDSVKFGAFGSIDDRLLEWSRIEALDLSSLTQETYYYSIS